MVGAARLDLARDDVRRPRAGRSFSGVTSPRQRTARPGPGKGWRSTRLEGRPELAAERPHLVLEELAQGLDQLQLEVVGQAADVVVALDGGRGAAVGGHRLDHVGVERALAEEARILEAGRLLAEHLDELVADDLALALGIGDALQLR